MFAFAFAFFRCFQLLRRITFGAYQSLFLVVVVVVGRRRRVELIEHTVRRSRVGRRSWLNGHVEQMRLAGHEVVHILPVGPGGTVPIDAAASGVGAVSQAGLPAGAAAATAVGGVGCGRLSSGDGQGLGYRSGVLRRHGGVLEARISSRKSAT